MIVVNEMFHSIQTEGKNSGMACLFIRFQGCDVGCPWCDTKQTWDYKPDKKITFDQLIEQAELEAFDKEQACECSPAELLKYLKMKQITKVVITGGEPCSQVGLRELTDCLCNEGIYTCIETSGTYPVDVHALCHVTVSPKINMAGGLSVIKETLERANEIKLVIDRLTDFYTFMHLMDSMALGVDFDSLYLQPCSQKKRSTEACVKLAKTHNANVSIQLHKVLLIR